jgi:hypothetical protein
MQLRSEGLERKETNQETGKQKSVKKKEAIRLNEDKNQERQKQIKRIGKQKIRQKK